MPVALHDDDDDIIFISKPGLTSESLLLNPDSLSIFIIFYLDFYHDFFSWIYYFLLLNLLFFIIKIYHFYYWNLLFFVKIPIKTFIIKPGPIVDFYYLYF